MILHVLPRFFFQLFRVRTHQVTERFPYSLEREEQSLKSSSNHFNPCVEWLCAISQFSNSMITFHTKLADWQ